MKPTRELPLLHKGDIIGEGDSSYVVQRKLGEGQFAEVWEVKQISSSYDVRYALKLEKRKDRSTVKAEYKALTRLKGNSQVIAVEGCGTHDERFYMLLQLAGETLYEARKNALGGRMDLPTVKAVGLSTLTAIQQVHEAKWIHRDIKPANFVLDPPNSSAYKGSWVLIDFGLVRRYADDNGSHLPQRPDASFRGSTAYASVHAHKGEDLSRRDDLWSWLYMLAELVDGGLPWRPDKDAGEHLHVDKQWVLHRKQECVQQPHLLCRTVQIPEPLVSISQHIASLAFEDAPNYEYLRQCLQQLPDPQVQLRDLTGDHVTQQQQQLLQQQLMNGQQQWDTTAGQPSNGLVQQPDWAAAAAAVQAQQQQHLDQQQLMLTPESPPDERLSPGFAGVPAAAAAAAAKRPAPVELDMEQLAKRRRSNSSHLQPYMASPAAASAGAAGGEPSSRPSSRHGSKEPSALGNGMPPGPQPSSSIYPCSRSNSIEVHRQQLDTGQDASGQQQAGRMVAAAAGSGATEIADLLAAFQSEAALQSQQATEQVVQQLCHLPPTQAVCAIALTLDKLVHQSDAACRPAVRQILQDLAEYITEGAASLQDP